MSDRRYRAGDSLEDICRVCKADRMHTVIAADPDGRPLRVSCGFCGSEHKWRGGSLVLRPGTAGLQEKSWPIETFFHKVVMVRNRLRTLEQQVNSLEAPEDVKVRLQGYITGCYGSLTSFNVLFADEDDQFKGSGD